MPNPLVAGNVGYGPFSRATWPWQKTRSSGEKFTERIAASQLPIANSLAEEKPLPPPPPMMDTVLRRQENPRPNSKLWNTFRQTMKNTYGMNEKWLDLRAGPLKTHFANLHHLRKYLQGLRSDEEKLGSFIKDLREATVRSMNEISEFNDLNINDGVFRRFLSDHVPEIDGRSNSDEILTPAGGPTEQDPDQEELVRKLTAWFQ